MDDKTQAALGHTPEDVERTKMWDRFQLPFSWFAGSVPYLPPDYQRFRQIPFDRRNDASVSNVGAITCVSHIDFSLYMHGEAIAGSISQHIGRRITIICLLR